MDRVLVRSWGLLVSRGVIAVLFGLLALVWPQITVLVLVMLFGLYAIVDGLAALVLGLGGSAGPGRGWLLAMGVVGIAAGLLAFIWPAITAVVLAVLIGLWAIVTGVSYLVVAWQLRGQVPGDWLLGLTGVLAVGLGLVLLITPGTGAVALAWAIGLLALAWGLATIALGLRLRGVTRGPVRAPRVV